MKVTRSMVDPGLRGRWLPGRLMARLLGTRWFSPLALRLGRTLLAGRDAPGLDCGEQILQRDGRPPLRLRIYRPQAASAAALPVMLYLHGGGYVHGVPEQFTSIIKAFIDTVPCIVVAPDYRKASQAPYPAAFDDSYDTLLWLRDNAATLGGRDAAFILAGHSAGGGLAAAVSLKARDTGQVRVAFQMPVYPMLDDRGQSASMRDNNAPVWDASANAQAWGQYLRGVAEVDAYAAPARARDAAGLPPTISLVGSIDPFADETQAYVHALEQAGVPVAFGMFDGAFHAFDGLVPAAPVSRQAQQFLLGHFRDYVQRYLG